MIDYVCSNAKSGIVKESINRIKRNIPFLYTYKDKNIVEKCSKIKIDRFRKDNLLLMERQCDDDNIDDLNSIFDVFVCGSDQIWSPLNYNPRFFLDYVNDTNRMLSYAPSIGVSSIEDVKLKEEIMRLTRRFKYLSVREKTGAKILRSFGEHPVVTVDPTLLLNENSWKKYTSDLCSGERYLLLYLLRYNKKNIDIAYKLARCLDLNLKIIPVVNGVYNMEATLINGVGTDDFLSLIKNAAFVCTDSFHGSIFSLIFKKQFITFDRFKENEKDNQNSRVYDFFAEIGLLDRIFKEKCPRNKIDYGSVDNRITVLRNKSLQYIDSFFADFEK